MVNPNNNSGKKTDSVRKALLLFDEKREGDILGAADPIPSCTSLLRAMELTDSDEESDLLVSGEGEEDNEFSTLPKEWLCPDLGLVSAAVEDGAENSQSSVEQGDKLFSPEVAPVGKKKKVEKKKCGPIEVERRSTRGTMMADQFWRKPRRLKENGMKVMAKVQNQHPPLSRVLIYQMLLMLLVSLTMMAVLLETLMLLSLS